MPIVRFSEMMAIIISRNVSNYNFWNHNYNPWFVATTSTIIIIIIICTVGQKDGCDSWIGLCPNFLWKCPSRFATNLSTNLFLIASMLACFKDLRHNRSWQWRLQRVGEPAFYETKTSFTTGLSDMRTVVSESRIYFIDLYKLKVWCSQHVHNIFIYIYIL